MAPEYQVPRDRIGGKACGRCYDCREQQHDKPGADLVRSLSDPDPLERGLAAMALRDQGKASLPTLDALVASLKDPETAVRMMAANAIAAIGPDASTAVPALTATCSAAGEEVHVLRACAIGLGAMGKSAASALPVLRELVTIARVEWAARAAIERIESASR